MKKEIVIAGYGFVGKAVANAIQDTVVLHIVDPKVNDSIVSDFKYAAGVIICVGTPSLDNGDCDASQIYSVMQTVPEELPVLIKCTTRPDYLDQIINAFPNHNIAYSPEFLRAVTANEDFANQTYMILGGRNPGNIWGELFSNSLKNLNNIEYCTITEATMVKYSINNFLATKVAFFNQIFDICEKNGADFNKVRELILLDERIGASHTVVPGPDGGRGYGGACFPKDTKAFVHYTNDLNTPITIVQAAVEYNDKLTQKL